ncbi:inovirus-type Gp2 protein [Psychrobacter sp. Ps1]|uniref:YagK/YfjJ domain-containing protein n=1 Tax=Psychrobacter sp. Ps1 TaxID=2790955 RepID=UPI001EDDBE56|nr:inovirus-type Gp2 protein [Psychrobacter sp. Ps1]MCG3841900.1 inovirus-type Gp2 protein [Psychrobacter sp. Ps1]
MIYSPVNHSQLISNVDRLVRDVLFGTISFQQIKSRLNELYYSFIISFDPEFKYLKPIQAFIESTNIIVGDAYPYNVFWDNEKTVQFIQLLLSHEKTIRKDYSAWRYQSHQNGKRLENNVRTLISNYSRLLFVRVDLKYIQENSHHITIRDFDFHMKKLREAIHNGDTCFTHLLRYAWSLEQGEENGGFHCHLLLIFDSSKHYQDNYLADQVGQKWRDITDDVGYCFVLNTREYKEGLARYGKLGIGMIHRNNLQEVENAVNAALYLTGPDKPDGSYQRLKVSLPNMKSFGQSMIH